MHITSAQIFSIIFHMIVPSRLPPVCMDKCAWCVRGANHRANGHRAGDRGALCIPDVITTHTKTSPMTNSDMRAHTRSNPHAICTLLNHTQQDRVRSLTSLPYRTPLSRILLSRTPMYRVLLFTQAEQGSCLSDDRGVSYRRGGSSKGEFRRIPLSHASSLFPLSTFSPSESVVTRYPIGSHLSGGITHPSLLPRFAHLKIFWGYFH